MTTIGQPTAADVMRQLHVITDKLDALLQALAADDEDEDDGVVHSLDGSVVSRPRNENESLG